jgi:hypothetical protein
MCIFQTGQISRYLTIVALLASGCGFSPRIPDGTIVCNQSRDCPGGLVCTPATDGTASLCCRGGICPARVTAGGNGGPGPAADGAAPTSDARPAAGADAGAAPAPQDAASNPPDSAPADAAPAAPAFTCSGGAMMTPPNLSGDRRLLCAILLGDSQSTLGMEIITGTNLVGSVSQGSCQATLNLPAQTADPEGGGARPLTGPSLDGVVTLVQKFKQICADLRGTVVGVAGSSWARQVTNRAEVLARVRAETQLELEVPTEAQEIEHRYRGATRNRTGRIVLDEGRDVPEILVWPQGASSPTRLTVPISYQETGSMFLAAPAHTSFESARVALRARLFENMRAPLANLANLVDDEDVASAVAIGPGSDATVPLAIQGGLRDQAGWLDPARYQARLDAGTTMLSSYGRVHGVVTPTQVDDFFESINLRDFSQLRSDPIRSRYGERVLLTTVILDILGDEVLATEFGFTSTGSYLGYLFSKIAPELDQP